MEILKCCPLCRQEMNSNEIHFNGGAPTLFHRCVCGIQIKVQGDSKHEVSRRWNTFVAFANK
jgi:hypothetical protein